MSTAKSLLLAGSILASLALVGCKSETKTTSATSATSTAATVNAKCPMSGKPVDGAHTVSYKGQTVGFCCGNCPGTWAKLSDADKDAKLAAAQK